MLWRMQPRWLDDEERAAWLRLVGVVELLPGVLDTQLRQDSGLSHFEYFSLAMLSEAPDHTLRMGPSPSARTPPCRACPMSSHAWRAEGWSSAHRASRTGEPPTRG